MDVGSSDTGWLGRGSRFGLKVDGSNVPVTYVEDDWREELKGDGPVGLFIPYIPSYQSLFSPRKVYVCKAW